MKKYSVKLLIFNFYNLFLFQSKKSDELTVQLQSMENEKSSLHAVVSTQERQISDLNIKVLNIFSWRIIIRVMTSI